MSIRPVEFSGVVQRSQDISTVKQNEDNKSMLQQQNVQTQFAKDTVHHMQQVTHANDSDNPKKKFDAREKGSNEYEDRRNKKKRAEEKNSGKVSVKTTGGFDMKI
ncbi:hypothetical protein C805_01984 [Eubacterium sp. 14-2]|uniref:hypothetical protein n=1 Tax=Eubacterium sp. 14-2 TaxID=1235790 RepID=UPI00033D767F|nr:hypothetical protein [Eubacterium sp. 14-2]EOT26012.1 hypothetical protein C805_01984 [Eubacterium sp. 14-2]